MTIEFHPREEQTHAPSDLAHWNESYYMNFFDVGGKWGGASRISFSPNQAFADGFICLYLPDGSTGFIRVWESCDNHQGRNAAGPIVHICHEPYQQWGLQYQGPIYCFEDPERMGDFGQTVLTDLPTRDLTLDLRFDTIHEPFDFHASMKRGFLSPSELLAKLRPEYLFGHMGPAFRKVALMKTMSGAQHYEQAGRISGTITLDGESHALQGFGQRDHSWGVRDMRVPSNWRWFSGQFADELCFNAIRVELLGMRVSGGYVYHEGKADPLEHWSYEAEMDDAGRWARTVALTLRARGGATFDITGTALQNIPVFVNTGGHVCVVNEAHAEFRWAEKVGRGISEFMQQVSP